MGGLTNKPMPVKLSAGEKAFLCMCMKSDNMPYCDGSHKGSGIAPKKVQFDEDKVFSACGCGKSQNLPYCDGSHKSF